MVSAVNFCHVSGETRSRSRADSRWCSVSLADLIEMSRKRANSLFVAAPQPSAMFVAMPSAARVSCDLKWACPARENPDADLCNAIANACARCHAFMSLKSCTLARYRPRPLRHHHFHQARSVFSHLAPRASHLAPGLTVDVAIPVSQSSASQSRFNPPSTPP
jgi:hypothetical protein